VAEAFDVTRADPKLQEGYGRNSFGWSLLLAARLVEAGVRLVQVNLGNDETWRRRSSTPSACPPACSGRMNKAAPTLSTTANPSPG